MKIGAMGLTTTLLLGGASATFFQDYSEEGTATWILLSLTGPPTAKLSFETFLECAGDDCYTFVVWFDGTGDSHWWGSYSGGTGHRHVSANGAEIYHAHKNGHAANDIALADEESLEGHGDWFSLAILSSESMRYSITVENATIERTLGTSQVHRFFSHDFPAQANALVEPGGAGVSYRLHQQVGSAIVGFYDPWFGNFLHQTGTAGIEGPFGRSECSQVELVVSVATCRPWVLNYGPGDWMFWKDTGHAILSQDVPWLVYADLP